MDVVLDLTLTSAGQTWLTFLRNWPFLAVSVFLAALLKLTLDPRRVSAFLLRYQKVGVAGATLVSVATPLCSCGTTAVMLGMIANLMPWAPVVAFMVASPLTSPQELVYSAGLFGWPFASAFFIASILLGLLGGAVAGSLDRRGWLKNQTRLSLQTAPAILEPPPAVARPVHLALQPVGALCCAAPALQALPLDAAGCGCGSAPSAPPACACPTQEPKSRPVSLELLLPEMFATARRLLVMFFGFAFMGYFLNGLIPPTWITTIFGSGNVFNVLLAATLGLPLYVNTEASLPLVRTMLDAGMSQGAALAFLITGAGTSFGALGGLLTIARWRVVTLVIGTLWIGAVLFGTAYNLLF